MGGKTFLLSFEDEDLFIMLEDLQWAYLKEIFCNVVMWLKEQSTPNRETWIEVRGLPLHTWNGTYLKRIVELWGNIEAYGDNGNESHEIHIFELGFKDRTIDPLIQAKLKKSLVISDYSQSEDSPECSSSMGKKGDDVEQISLIEKEDDKEDG
ncbi:hypothetical protein V6N13_033811 [Hibiscus sabdariffa]